MNKSPEQIKNEMDHLSRMNRGIETERIALLDQNKSLERVISDNARKLAKLSVDHTANTDAYIKLSAELNEPLLVTRG